MGLIEKRKKNIRGKLAKYKIDKSKIGIKDKN